MPLPTLTPTHTLEAASNQYETTMLEKKLRKFLQCYVLPLVFYFLKEVYKGAALLFKHLVVY